MKSTYFAHKFAPDRNPKGRKDSVLWGFYSSLMVCRITYGSALTYYKVEVTPFEGPEEDALYWAWWSNGGVTKTGRNPTGIGFCHVYYFKGMVKMCFPYDIEIYEKKGAGKLMPVNATIIETIQPGKEER